MKKTFSTSAAPSGFSLAEVLTALVIGSMVLVCVLGIYGRAERSAAAVTRKLDSSRLPAEILQRIAEDLDGIISTGSDTKIAIENKFDEHGFPTAMLTITKTFYDKRDKEQIFEKIVWQSTYDLESNIDGMVIYRSHSGINAEDKLLDKKKDDWERELFVPICTGVTFFKIRATWGQAFLDRWLSSSMPGGIEVTISFAEPVKKVDGTLEVPDEEKITRTIKKVDGMLDVPDEEKITRTIAIDRTRKIRFAIEKKEYDEEEGMTRVEVPDGGTLQLGGPKKPKETKR